MDLAAAREEGRHEESRRVRSRLGHPATIERIAGAFYEQRTARAWRTADEIDRIAYIASAREVVGVVLASLVDRQST